MAAPKMTKNQMRRAKKKEQKKAVKEDVDQKTVATPEEPTRNGDAPPQAEPELEVKEPEPEVQTEAIVPDVLDDDSAFAEYRDIFAKFGANTEEDQAVRDTNDTNRATMTFDNDDQIPDEDDEEELKVKLSKKKRKAINTLSVAELKALVRVPDVVEWTDVSSNDPRLLVQIKAQRNVVPVPTHWSLKREYLSSKRGVEKPPFSLPKFIAETGITEMRDAVLEKQAEQTLKQKQRERVAPKMGKLDIDYQKLYDAFFRFQDKPNLTRFGEVYYEGKESEADYQHFRPGELSDEAKEALGIPPGAPPPWLINQQRIGTPPSYPTLKIPGLNAPPPPGGSWGFHPGGWGKPPVDEYNRPLYGGDVFGLTGQNGAQQPQQQQAAQPQLGEPVERELWGEVQPRGEESEAEEESDEEESDEDEDEDGPAADGLETPGGLETPSVEYPGQGAETSIAGEMDLRKERRGYDTEEHSGPRSAYTILPERQVRAEGFFGSDRAYEIPGGGEGRPPVLGAGNDERKRKKPGDVDVALDPETLQSSDGLSKDELRRRFEEGRREDGVGAKWTYDDDLSEMIAQESRKRQKTEQERGEKRREGKYKF